MSMYGIASTIGRECWPSRRVIQLMIVGALVLTGVLNMAVGRPLVVHRAYAAASITGLQVVGNQIVDGNNDPARLRRSGSKWDRVCLYPELGHL